MRLETELRWIVHQIAELIERWPDRLALHRFAIEHSIELLLLLRLQLGLEGQLQVLQPAILTERCFADLVAMKTELRKDRSRWIAAAQKFELRIAFQSIAVGLQQAGIAAALQLRKVHSCFVPLVIGSAIDPAAETGPEVAIVAAEIHLVVATDLAATIGPAADLAEHRLVR